MPPVAQAIAGDVLADFALELSRCPELHKGGRATLRHLARSRPASDEPGD
jgi:hypothetical protein